MVIYIRGITGIYGTNAIGDYVEKDGQVRVEIDRELLEWAEKKAKEEGKSLDEFVVDCIKSAMDEK